VSTPTPRSRRRLTIPADEQVQIQIRLTPELRKRLTAEADRRVVSVNLLAERAIEHALNLWEKQRLP
jgi:predicted HicB family RNase H-like nuclease